MASDSDSLRILGIDPGSLLTGFGVIDYHKSNVIHVDHGVVRVAGDSLVEKLQCIFSHISDVIEKHQPTEVAIETVFMGKNVDSALKLGQARGAAIVACGLFNLTCAEYAPRKIKQTIVGSGAADKSQVQHMVKQRLNLAGTIQADAADALAIALCHGQHSGGGELCFMGRTARRLRAEDFITINGQTKLRRTSS